MVSITNTVCSRSFGGIYAEFLFSQLDIEEYFITVLARNGNVLLTSES